VFKLNSKLTYAFSLRNTTLETFSLLENQNIFQVAKSGKKVFVHKAVWDFKKRFRPEKKSGKISSFAKYKHKKTT
jgi:hypothetical protein